MQVHELTMYHKTYSHTRVHTCMICIYTHTGLGATQAHELADHTHTQHIHVYICTYDMYPRIRYVYTNMIYMFTHVYRIVEQCKLVS